MDHSLPGSSPDGILQARILEWVLCPPPGDLPDQGTNPGLPHCRQILYPQSYAGFGETKRDRGNSFCFVELTINSREMDINYQNKLGLLLLPQGTSLMAQVVKNLPAMQEIQV